MVLGIGGRKPVKLPLELHLLCTVGVGLLPGKLDDRIFQRKIFNVGFQFRSAHLQDLQGLEHLLRQELLLPGGKIQVDRCHEKPPQL